MSPTGHNVGARQRGPSADGSGSQPPGEANVERAAKRAGWIWIFLLASLTMIGAGFGASTALLAWRVDVLKAGLDSINRNIDGMRADVKAVETTVIADRERMVRVETTLGLMPGDTVQATRHANKKVNAP